MAQPLAAFISRFPITASAVICKALAQCPVMPPIDGMQSITSGHGAQAMPNLPPVRQATRRGGDSIQGLVRPVPPRDESTRHARREGT